ncbi:hypothetical protein PRIPAC_74885 [Pristionchus pacificus]|uniref:Uncharacterized protein n=1 Tax=Pristionchus pacificus TaxID=54126 RepID=A0A2A6C8V4_PRIPA|nr:hypothetical protein PRIPAC_74885 [Pristionchus pacificus]|eukprot:PDM74589.1 hypothetical protein PRIPAC_41945 [Pristionchus pacificus]
MSPAFELCPAHAHSPVSSPVVTSADPVEVEFDSSSTWPIYSPQRTASALNDESDKVDLEFPRAWSPVDDVGLVPSSWLVPAPSPECDPEAIAADCPVWAPGPPPYSKAVMKSEKEECDSTIDTISAFIELECTPKMKSVSEAMNAIGEALKIKENPTGADLPDVQGGPLDREERYRALVEKSDLTDAPKYRHLISSLQPIPANFLSC